MITKETCLELLAPFSRSSLEDSKNMAFLNRFDTKFVLRTGGVSGFLKNIANDYSVLQIEDMVIQSYETVYFDTPDLLCFNMHHNKRAQRFKFRTRKYLSNGKIFNEIKQKQNTGKTKKFRQRRDGIPDEIPNPGFPMLPAVKNLSDFDEHFIALVNTHGYGYVGELIPSLNVYFNRVTFLNKNFPERMTLDFGLSYAFNGLEFKLYDTAIVEQKREKGPEKTFSQEYFRSIHKNPSGFSKYTIGISLTHAEARKNRFLPRLRSLAFEREAAA
ncbi:MAG: VTC domain-containing protein [Chitinispirillia bacterium]|nr:VTC domain-containing protein [Chitinispirillia bacterium]MCL2242062.1 VTC domain-containing protein [Chitinispirillia bacterium]